MLESGHKATWKYLQREAEPEARSARAIGTQYRQALIVPARDESAELTSGLWPALQAAPGTLLIVVVNADRACAAAVRATNQLLLSELRGLGRNLLFDQANLCLLQLDQGGLLLVDRTSPGRELAERQGVGLARKVGCDIALSLWAEGKLECPWLCTTDADATLPQSYFAAVNQAAPRAGAVLWEFEHRPCDDEEVTAATLEYELYLRYYALGLAWAKSPYAFLALGSCMAVRAEAYAKVRGFPKRAAGEDFHLLAKLAKVAPIQKLDGDPISIQARRSWRTPFGTGARVQALLSGEALGFHDPRVFAALRTAHDALHSWAEDPAEYPPERREAGVFVDLLQELGLQQALSHASRVASDAQGRWRQLQTWFDALKTLRFVHGLEQRAQWPRLGWQSAVAAAPFLGEVELGASASKMLQRLRELARAQDRYCGL